MLNIVANVTCSYLMLKLNIKLKYFDFVTQKTISVHTGTSTWLFFLSAILNSLFLLCGL